MDKKLAAYQIDYCLDKNINPWSDEFKEEIKIANRLIASSRPPNKELSYCVIKNSEIMSNDEINELIEIMKTFGILHSRKICNCFRYKHFDFGYAGNNILDLVKEDMNDLTSFLDSCMDMDDFDSAKYRLATRGYFFYYGRTSFTPHVSSHKLIVEHYDTSLFGSYEEDKKTKIQKHIS